MVSNLERTKSTVNKDAGFLHGGSMFVPACLLNAPQEEKKELSTHIHIHTGALHEHMYKHMSHVYILCMCFIFSFLEL